MKKTLIAAAAALAIASTQAYAGKEDARYIVSTGSKAGTYMKVGINLTGMVDGGYVEKSKGSVMNLERLAAGEAHVAPVQLDALAWYSAKHPDKAAEFEVLGPLYKECAYMAVRCDGPISDEDDIKKGVTIAAGKKGSGPAVTWDYMRQLESSYKTAAVSFSGGTRALGRVAAGTEPRIDGMLWVTKPGIKGNKHLATVMKNDKLCMIDMDDYSLNNTHEGLGKPIYEFQKIDIAKGIMNDTEIVTACVDAVLVARSDLDEDLLDELADAVLNYKASLLK